MVPSGLWLGRKRDSVSEAAIIRSPCQLFNFHLIEELSLMPKLRFVKSISGVPKGIAADIERLNSLRNAMAHSFFPENLKRQNPVWKG